MINNVILKRVIVVVFSTAMFTDTGIAYAFDMCKNMFGKMNQSKMEQSEWRSDYRDHDDYYGDPGVGSGYGYRRGRGFGYGSPDYGYGGPPAPSYGHTVPAYAAPHPGSDALQAEIDQLKQRIKNLEEIDQLKQQIKNLEKALTHESFRPQDVPTDPGTG
jgi:hypothetical protein